MEDLCRSGKVRYIACSNYRAWEIVDLIHKSKQHNWQPISAVQPLYTIVNRDIEVELLPMTEHYGLGVASYSSLARGILTGKYGRGAIPKNSRLDRRDPRSETTKIDRCAEARPLARRLGCTLSQLATRWAMANQSIHSALLGHVQLNKQKMPYHGCQWDSGQNVVDDLFPGLSFRLFLMKTTPLFWEEIRTTRPMDSQRLKYSLVHCLVAGHRNQQGDQQSQNGCTVSLPIIKSVSTVRSCSANIHR